MESGSSGRCRAWSLVTLEGPPQPVVDASQDSGTHVGFQWSWMSVLSDRSHHRNHRSGLRSS